MLGIALTCLAATMPPIIRFLSAGLLALAFVVHANDSRETAPAFELVALGVQGGLQDGDLSAWLARAPHDERYVALDAGTLLPGIGHALRRGAFGTPPSPADTPSAAGRILRDRIAGYFVSHPHLDHVAGLLIAATDDTRKPIYGLASTLQALSDDYFNWSAWPNFADRGPAPALGQYALRDEAPRQWFAIEGTSLHGLLLPLQHDRMTSSLLLVRSGEACLAYFGDTGPDAVQHGTRLAEAWRMLAPLVRDGALKGLVIETSYPDDVADDRLYGHLTPRWLLRELHAFAAEAGEGALRGLPVVIGHIKPSLQPGRDTRSLIESQLRAGNDLQVRFVLPRQGDRLVL